MSEKTEIAPPATSATQGTPQQVVTDQLKSYYANVCRITQTPNEMIIDFGLNPNFFGPLLDEPLRLETRIIMSQDAAKRLCVHLVTAIKSYEQKYGEIELDVNKRLKPQK